MGQIITAGQISKITQKLNLNKKRVVLVGGCFDILHLGHVIFLEKAAKKGNVLVVLLESDRDVAKRKGQGRPIHTQKDRARVLAALSSVDFVVLLPKMKSDLAYDKIVQKIKPQVIATTANDPEVEYKKRSAKNVNAEVKIVTKRIKDHSSSKTKFLLEN
ncbi:adenylyltransferase/cytidyltransferase family protein [Candidatus Daviesbacteria bacterium]|nr:adenylyltransferase/cytidyltransferase family protein [Candidatus Daviesbacteria bacterium]